MKLLCWNVNSIKVRLPRLLAVLQRHDPDVVCLQETKTVDASFPLAALQAAGYHCTIWGQKTYNGVAILSKQRPTAVSYGFAHPELDAQARLLGVSLQGVRLLCAYVPNGSSVDSPKFAYKLRWLQQLHHTLQQCHSPDERLIVCGDLNIAPRPCDVAQPEIWEPTVLCHPQARAALAQLLQWGLQDVFAQAHPQGGVYSWWDYRQLGFAKNNGLRIDHVLSTAALAQRCVHSSIDRDERKGAQPSDHAPVLASFDL